MVPSQAVPHRLEQQRVMQDDRSSNMSARALIRRAQQTLSEAERVLAESIALRLQLHAHREAARAIVSLAHEDHDVQG